MPRPPPLHKILGAMRAAGLPIERVCVDTVTGRITIEVLQERHDATQAEELEKISALQSQATGLDQIAQQVAQ